MMAIWTDKVFEDRTNNRNFNVKDMPETIKIEDWGDEVVKYKPITIIGYWEEHFFGMTKRLEDDSESCFLTDGDVLPVKGTMEELWEFADKEYKDWQVYGIGLENETRKAKISMSGKAKAIINNYKIKIPKEIQLTLNNKMNIIKPSTIKDYFKKIKHDNMLITIHKSEQIATSENKMGKGKYEKIQRLKNKLETELDKNTYNYYKSYKIEKTNKNQGLAILVLETELVITSNIIAEKHRKNLVFLSRNLTILHRNLSILSRNLAILSRNLAILSH